MEGSVARLVAHLVRGAGGAATRAILAALLCVGGVAHATTFYVRQSMGDDAADGRSPSTAWRHVSKLSNAMQAGDTAYVGPGLYREQITVEHDGRPDAAITFVADTSGRHTGDPPGPVVLAGSEPVDETIFAPLGPPGVFRAAFPDFVVWGAVEMDGPQQRYVHATITHEYLVEKKSAVDVVALRPSSWFYDEATRVLYLHTSDGRPPAAHELELIRRGDGIFVQDKHYVTVIGFTFRHMQDAGVSFFKGSSNGLVSHVISYGNRQGVRIYGARDVTVHASTLFRNENCGAYFAAESTGGAAIDNVAYENVKGLRWSSGSHRGRAVRNVLFDNLERGLSLEEVEDAVVIGNRLVGNRVSQLYVLQSHYVGDDNCFANGDATQLVADFTPFGANDRFVTLSEYQRAKGQDRASRETGCGSLPAKVDVHAQSTSGPVALPFVDAPRSAIAGGPTSSRLRSSRTHVRHQ
ncbi:MAG TPA: right-handed parallel beta-helix repeat-containing protein [Candidatus Eisenbacteria bacterium]|nr:right-handed parallel beta-helix repeat-containing protein [Candidatus Eisenbacteria bacterium]